MGRVSIAAFRPTSGKSLELPTVIADRLPLLRWLGLATDHPDILVRSRDGVVITISDWTSEEAIERTRRTPEVVAVWERLEACSDSVKLDTPAKSHEGSATFEAICGVMCAASCAADRMVSDETSAALAKTGGMFTFA